MASHEQFQILLVEDSPTSAELAHFWLEDGLRRPFLLHKATHLSSALDILKSGVIDLTILDLNLPDSSGLETFLAVHACSSKTPIVVLSGNADEELAVEAVRLGAQDYVVKDNAGKNVLALPVRFAWERVQRHRAEKALGDNERQLFVARSVQQYLLPDTPPTVAGFDIASLCEPAELIGGDYYDFIPLPGNHWGLVIADVSGHGMAAALMMVEIRAVLRSLVRNYSSLSDILETANELITPDLDGRFVTAFFGVLDPANRTLRYGSAAHPALVIHANGESQKLKSFTLPLGIHEGEMETSEEIVLTDGDLLVLYTDGLIERFNSSHDLFGMSRFVECLRENRHRTAAEIAASVTQTVSEFAGGQAQTDDETLVIIRVEPRQRPA